MENIYLLIKALYLLIPKLIRDQYADSITLYKAIALRIINRLSTNTVTLVDSIESLNCGIDIIHHEGNRFGKINGQSLIIGGYKYQKSGLKNNLSDVKIYLLRGVSVIGGTDALVTKKVFYHNELKLMSKLHDLKRPEIFISKNGMRYRVRTKTTKKTKKNKMVPRQIEWVDPVPMGPGKG